MRVLVTWSSERSPARLVAYGVAGWVVAAAALATSTFLHAFVAPIVFLAIALAYFRRPGAREPLATAIAFTAIVALLHVAVAGPSVMMRTGAYWVPLGLIFLITWLVGAIASMRPLAKPREPSTTTSGTP